MHILRDKKKTKGGQTRTYIALAQSVWEKKPDGRSRSKPVIIARLGTEEELDVGAVAAARDALGRYLERRLAEEGRSLDAVEAVAKETRSLAPSLRVLASRQYGLRVLVESVWKRMGLKRTLREVGRKRDGSFDFERVVLGMVLNRIADPKSKRACNEWLQGVAWFPEVEGLGVHAYYRAMDHLYAHEAEVLRSVRRHVLGSGGRGEGLSLVLLDTTATYVETEWDDRDRQALKEAWSQYDREGGEAPTMPRPQVVNEEPLRLRGHSKDHRPDRPQVVVGALADGAGRLLHLRTFPGNTNDQRVTQELIRTVAEDLKQEGRPVVVMDSGTGGGPNLSWLDGQGLDRVSSVPLRTGKLVELLLSRSGRWREVKGRPGLTMRVMRLSSDESPSGREELWVATRNLRERERALRKLERHLERVRGVLSQGGDLSRPEVCALQRNSVYKRYVREAQRGHRLVLDRRRIQQEKRRAGVKVLRSTLVDRPPEETLACYQSQLGIEAGFRTLKTPLRLRPMYHRKSERIHAHVLINGLALSVVQELERSTGLTVERLRALFGNVQAVHVQQGRTRFWMRQEWTPEQAAIIDRLDLGPLPRRWGAQRVDAEVDG